ncbi:MAG: hypothetical protein ACOH5I_19845 [Oligoflexus sp.]
MNFISSLMASWIVLSSGFAISNPFHTHKIMVTVESVNSKGESTLVTLRIAPECRETFYAAQQLRYDLLYFAERVSRFAERSQLEFAIRSAERAVAGIHFQAFRLCNRSQLERNLDTVREHLDVVRRLFRGNAAFTSEPELFEAFRTMVYSWEALRDSIVF